MRRWLGSGGGGADAYRTSRAGSSSRPAFRPVAAGLAAALAGALLLSGCGIRTTTVPVDAGPAPSRLSCAAPKTTGNPPPDTVVRQVYLLCETETAPLSRNVVQRPGSSDRLKLVEELLAQLQRSPLGAEAAAGFSSAVPGTLGVRGPMPGDPKEALRLSLPLDELPTFALAQIVCTLAADTMIAPDHSIVLGSVSDGMGEEQGELRRYTCTPELRSRPEAADSAGTWVG